MLKAQAEAFSRLKEALITDVCKTEVQKTGKNK